jgi:hypothetical protein
MFLAVKIDSSLLKPDQAYLLSSMLSIPVRTGDFEGLNRGRSLGDELILILIQRHFNFFTEK